MVGTVMVAQLVMTKAEMVMAEAGLVMTCLVMAQPHLHVDNTLRS